MSAEADRAGGSGAIAQPEGAGVSVVRRHLQPRRTEKPDYFGLIRTQMAFVQAGAQALSEGMGQEGLGSQELLEELFHLEQCSGEVNARVRAMLAVEFIAPIDRDGLLALTDVVDDVSSQIREVAASAYMFGFSEPTDAMIGIASKMMECSGEAVCVLSDIEHYAKKREAITTHLMRLRRCRQESDVACIMAIRALYGGSVLVTGEERQIAVRMYERLNAVIDALKEVGDRAEAVMIDNT